MHISVSEILLILVIAVLVIKPEKLPDAAYSVGKWVRWFKDLTGKLKNEMEDIRDKKI